MGQTWLSTTLTLQYFRILISVSPLSFLIPYLIIYIRLLIFFFLFRHDKTCNRGCTCKQQYVTAVALVVDDNGKNEDIDVADDDKYNENNVRLEVVKFPGWCKCFND